MTNVKDRYAAALFMAFALPGCAGTGVSPLGVLHGAASPPPGDGSTGSVRFGLNVPTLDGASIGRRVRHDVSPGTASVVITLASHDGAAPSGAQTPAIIDILPTSPDCAPATNGKDYLTCSVSFAAPSGNDVFMAKAYSEYDGVGALLSSGSASANVPASGTVDAPLTLDGIVSAITVTAATTFLPVGVKSPFTLFVVATDASGAAILGGDPYASPISLSVTDPDSATTLATASMTAPSATVDGTYDGTTGRAPHDVTISASAAGVKASSIIPATLHVDDERGWVSGAKFSFVGTQSTQVVPPTGTPPPATVSATKDTNTISTGATFNAIPGLIDVRAVDTSTTPGFSPSTTTSDEFYAYNETGSPVRVDYEGENVTTATGSTQTVTEQAESIYDELPEDAGGTWADTGTYSSTFVAASGDPNPSQHYDAANGAYSFEDTFADKQMASATANADGSGSYSYGPYSDGSEHSWTIGAPAAGSPLSITETIDPEGGGAPSTISADVTNWFAGGAYPATPLTDTYSDVGTVVVPAACGVASTYAGDAMEIDESYRIVDPVLGSILTRSRKDYVKNNVGRVCTLILSTQQFYYAIGNAANENDGTSLIFFGSLLYTVQSQSASGLQSYVLSGKSTAAKAGKT